MIFFVVLTQYSDFLHLLDTLINDVIEINIKDRLIEDFGVTMSAVDLSAIEVDTTSDSYIELKKITKDITMMSIEGKAKADLEHYQETLTIQREEQQYAAHLGTQSDNISAYQAGLQVVVGIAGANALGQMDANGAGNVDLGSGSGFNPMTMMAGIALGGAVVQNIANTMSNSMNGVNMNYIPPIPTKSYYVAKDGKQIGPFEINKLKEKIISGELVKESLLWTLGRSSWIQADTID